MSKIKHKIEKYIDKKYIGYSTRLIVNSILFLAFFFFSCVFLLKSFEINPEKKIDYNEKSNLDYKVFLKENSFYDTEFLDKDMIYVASLIDNVKVDFDYNFEADTDVNLDFKYSIFAKLIISEQNGKSKYFEKEYTLLEEKTGHLDNEKQMKINEAVSIDYSYYNSIANSFKTSYGVDADSNLVIYLKIDKNSENNEFFNDSDVMSFQIPLSERSVNIKMDYKEINNSSNLISKSNVTINNKLYIILTIISAGFSFYFILKMVKLLLLLFDKKNKYDKYISKLLTEYDRLISETSTLPNTKNVEIISIKKFQELIDIRDNLHLPIMYYSITKHQKSWFYITHDNKMYLYVVKAVDLENEK